MTKKSEGHIRGSDGTHNYSLIARVSVQDIPTNSGNPTIIEAALEVQTEIIRVASKCAAITKFGAIPARVLDFELLRGKGGIKEVVLHYEDPTHASGNDNYLTKTFGIPYFYNLFNNGSS